MHVYIYVGKPLYSIYIYCYSYEYLVKNSIFLLTQKVSLQHMIVCIGLIWGEYIKIEMVAHTLLLLLFFFCGYPFMKFYFIMTQRYYISYKDT